METLNATNPATLKFTVLNPGDILYMPSGSLFVEKTLKAHAISLRVASTMFVKEDVESLAILATAYQGTLALLQTMVVLFGCNVELWT